VNKPNWKEINETLSGKMENCLGAKCPEACCRQKTQETAESTATYFTSFCKGERAYREKESFPSPEMLGIRTRKEIARFETPNGIIFEPVILVDNCRRQNGKCKFEEMIDQAGPPLACRTQPFSHSTNRPIMSPECPRIVEIAGERKVIEGILRVRTLLGLTDNEKWLARLKEEVLKIRHEASR